MKKMLFFHHALLFRFIGQTIITNFWENSKLLLMEKI